MPPYSLSLRLYPAKLTGTAVLNLVRVQRCASHERRRHEMIRDHDDVNQRRGFEIPEYHYRILYTAVYSCTFRLEGTCSLTLFMVSILN
jgi:hypothetical protein